MSNFSVSGLVEKSKDLDKDIRQMALYDLHAELNKEGLQLSEDNQVQVGNIVLALLDDKSSEVQGMAVKCLAPLVSKMNKTQVEDSLKKLSDSIVNSEDEKRDIAALSMKTVVSKIDNEVAISPIQKCVPVLIKGVSSGNPDVVKDALDVLTDILKRFGDILTPQHSKLQDIFIQQVKSDHNSVVKRAINCLAQLSVYTDDHIFDKLIKMIIETIRRCLEDYSKLRTYLQATSTISKTAGHRFSNYLDEFIPLISDAAEKISEIEGEDEIREYILQSLESFVLRCSNEINPHIEIILLQCQEYVVYDPNYSYDTEDEDDENNMEEDNDDDIEVEEEEEEAGEYGDDAFEDDDDTSWKVRSAAYKCLLGVIQTKPDYLGNVFENFCSENDDTLLTRFKERTESVKLEIFNVYTELLKQCVSQISDNMGNISYVQHKQIEYVKETKELALKQLRKEFKNKSSKTKRSIFSVIKTMSLVLQGGLEKDLKWIVNSIISALNEKGEQQSTLKLEVLECVNLLLQTHTSETFVPYIKQLSKSIYEKVNDKYYKINAEALRVCRKLVDVIEKAEDQDELVRALFDTVYNRLTIQDIDQDVKESSIIAVGSIISSFGAKIQMNETVSVLIDRLGNEITRLTTCKTFDVIAKSRTKIDSKQLNTVLQELSSFLRKASRPLRLAALMTLHSFTTSYKSEISEDRYKQVLKELKNIINDSDLYLTHLALNLTSEILNVRPETSPDIKSSILPQIILLISSQTLQGNALSSSLKVLKQLVPVVGFSNLFKMVLGQGEKKVSKQVYTNVAKGIAAIVEVAPEKDQKNTISKFIHDLQSSKDESIQMLSLYVIGEIGQYNDLSQSDITKTISQFFDNGSEEIKNAASYSLGNVAIGNLSHFVPFIVENTKKTPSRRYLLIHSLKEVIIDAKTSELKPYIQSLVELLAGNCGNPEEGIRNVVAECLGKLALVDYDHVLKNLNQVIDSAKQEISQLKTKDQNGDVKEQIKLTELKEATAISSLKYCIVDYTNTLDDKLKEDIPKFMQHLNKDESVPVRRASVLLLNSAAHNKPVLIRESIESFLPNLYYECKFNKDLVLSMKLGPFTHKVDTALELRKSTFECMDTLLETLRDRLGPYKFVQQLSIGLSDPDPDIKTLCHLILLKTKQIFPSDVLRSLDDFVPSFNETLKKKLKDNAVKQEKERLEQLVKSTLKTVHELSKLKGSEVNVSFNELINSTINKDSKLKSKYEAVSKSEEQDMKDD